MSRDVISVYSLNSQKLPGCFTYGLGTRLGASIPGIFPSPSLCDVPYCKWCKHWRPWRTAMIISFQHELMSLILPTIYNNLSCWFLFTYKTKKYQLYNEIAQKSHRTTSFVFFTDWQFVDHTFASHNRVTPCFWCITQSMWRLQMSNIFERSCQSNITWHSVLYMMELFLLRIKERTWVWCHLHILYSGKYW